MNHGRLTSPVRGTFFFSVCLLLLITVGLLLQRLWKLPGNMLMQVLIFLGLSLAFSRWSEERPLREQFRLEPLSLVGLLKSTFLGLMAWALVQMLGVLLIYMVEQMGGKMPPVYQALLAAPYWLALIAGALIPAVCEELAFRGFILSSLGPLGARIAVLLTGILFGVMHLSVIRLIPLTILGLIFATAVQRSGSILPGMIMHFVNNATAITLAFFYKPAQPASQGGVPAMTTMSLVFSVAVVTALGLGVWGLARSFGSHDLRRAPAADTPAPLLPERRIPWLVMLAPLLLALPIYSWAVANELYIVFFAPR